MKFMHIRMHRYQPWNSDIPTPHGGVTIAYQKQDDDKYKVALAVCSEKDNYNKRTGRDEATKHMLDGKFITLQLHNNSAKTTQILQHLEQHFKYHILFRYLNRESMKFIKRAINDL